MSGLSRRPETLPVFLDCVVADAGAANRSPRGLSLLTGEKQVETTAAATSASNFAQESPMTPAILTQHAADSEQAENRQEQAGCVEKRRRLLQDQALRQKGRLMLDDDGSRGMVRSDMAVTIRRVARPKRKPGERANLTIEKISAVAFDVLETNGLDKFSARLVAKNLGVTPAAIYSHFDGGLVGLKRHLVSSALLNISRPYGPTDSPAQYLRDVFVRTLKSVRRKQGLAELIALELSRDHLVCPIFLERLFSAALGVGKPPPNPARVLDLVLAALIGMIMLEGETPADQKVTKLARSYTSRLKAYPPSEVPTLLATSAEQVMQVARRLIPNADIAAASALRYAEPVIVVLEAGKA